MTNWQLLNYCDYTNIRVFKRMLRKYYLLRTLAERGDSVAAAIFVDLKNALNNEGVLSARERYCVKAWIDGRKQWEIAGTYDTYQQYISRDIHRGIKKMQKFLC